MMKVLWITNLLFPEVCEKLNLPVPAIGGWMYSSAKLLNETGEVELAVAAVGPGKELQVFETEGIRYYVLPLKTNPIEYRKEAERYWQQVRDDFRPDIVHVHGTEFTHGLAYLKVCGVKNAVVSIQGLVSVYERYYYAGMGSREILRYISFRDVIRNDNIFQQKKKFRRRGVWEREYISRIPYVIGRTAWDKVHVTTVNPEAHYCFCNETLRSSFYARQWGIGQCERYSIFCSQASYPLKGLHQMLKALPLILKRYPDAMLYVSGTNILRWGSFMEKMKFSGYAKYVRALIRKLGITRHVVFLGMLGEEAMCERYLRSHVFVCPSAIENSPNSLGEAQLLGVPCVASYVGGVPDMVESGRDGLLYRFEEYEMLARQVCTVFGDDGLAEKLSVNARMTAMRRHDPGECRERLVQIYREILNES